jgi:hypothetical protein
MRRSSPFRVGGNEAPNRPPVAGNASQFERNPTPDCHQERFAPVRARMVEAPFLDFLDPWGNRLEIVEYANIQFTKTPHVLRGMEFALDKNEEARHELPDKSMTE